MVACLTNHKKEDTMRNVSDKELDTMLDGLSVGGIYRLAWTLVKAWMLYVLGLAVFGIAFAIVAGTIIAIILPS